MQTILWLKQCPCSNNENKVKEGLKRKCFSARQEKDVRFISALKIVTVSAHRQLAPNLINIKTTFGAIKNQDVQ